MRNDARGVAGKWLARGGHLVEDGTEREQVGPGVKFLASDLLGRHVSHRANHRPGASEGRVVSAQRRRGRDGLARIGFVCGQFRQAEVQNFRVVAVGNEQVGRLDVAMNDSFRVRGVERVIYLDREIQQPIDFERLPGNLLLKGLAFQEFHDNEGQTIVPANFVNGANVGMVQRGGGASFALKSFQRLGIFGWFLGKKFQRDKTAQVGVFRFVDDAHPATTQLF